MKNKRLILIVICIAAMIASLLTVNRMITSISLQPADHDSSTAAITESSAESGSEDSTAEPDMPESQEEIKGSDKTVYTADTVFTAEDIEQIAGTSPDSRDRTILKLEYKDYFLHSGITPQNNYQRVHYMLFDSPEKARDAFEKISTDLYEEDSVEISDDFVSGRERGVMDAEVESCFLLRGNMLVTASAAYSNYYDINDEEKVQAHNAENRKNYEELKEWLKSEF